MVGVLVSQAHTSPFPRPCMQVDAALLLDQRSNLLSAPVDSSADENFLDIDFAAQAGIAVESLPSPLDANALDGRLLARVTHSPKRLLAPT